MKKRIIVIIICMLAATLLSGCTFLYDVLNFSSENLPNPESLVENSLSNPYKYAENAMTSVEFAGVVESVRTKMDGTCDETVTISWSANPIVSTSDYSYGSEAYYLTRELKTLGKNTGTEDEAHTSFGEVVGYFPMHADTYYIYDDFFTHIFARYDADEDFYENIKPRFYTAAKKGSLMLRALDLLSGSLAGIDRDWENGKPVYAINSVATAAAVFDAIDFDFSRINQTHADFRGIKASFVFDENSNDDESVDDKIISKLNIEVEFAAETVLIKVVQNSFKPTKVENSGGYSEERLSAYEYHIVQQNYKIWGGNPDHYAEVGELPFKASVTHSVYDETTEKYKKETFTLYKTRETSFLKVINGMGSDSFEWTIARNVFIYTIVLGDGKTLYYDGYRCFLKENGGARQLVGDEYDYYRDNYFYVINLKYFYFYEINFLREADTYGITSFIEEIRTEWRGEYLSELWQVEQTELGAYTFDSDTDNIIKIEYEARITEFDTAFPDAVIMREVEGSLFCMEFEYTGFSRPDIPAEVLITVQYNNGSK